MKTANLVKLVKKEISKQMGIDIKDIKFSFDKIWYRIKIKTNLEMSALEASEKREQIEKIAQNVIEENGGFVSTFRDGEDARNETDYTRISVSIF